MAKLVRDTDSKIYKRDERGMKNIPSFLPILLSLELIISIVSGVVLLINLLTSGFNSACLVCSFIIIISIIHGIFCDCYYNWHEDVRYEISSEGKITYVYNLNECALTSKREVRIKINEVQKRKLKGKTKVTLYGNFSKRAPMQKPKTINKVVLHIDLHERDEILKFIDNEIERSK